MTPYPVGSKNYDVHGYVRIKVKVGAGHWVKEHILAISGDCRTWPPPREQP